MVTVAQVAQSMQTILGSVADDAAREAGFVQRESKMGGSEFASTLVFGWMANPEATLEELAQTAATLGVEITPQGLDQRFTASAAACVKRVLDAAVCQVIAADPVAVPLLQRFAGVYILDSSVVALPNALASVWVGCGNRTPTNAAALKCQVCLDLRTGEMKGPVLQDGRTHDRCSPFQRASLPTGALRITDLGFFSLDIFQTVGEQGVYWLSRLKVQTVVFDTKGSRQDLLTLLEAQACSEVDIQVYIGATHRLPCRLIAKRVPREVADCRRRKLRDEARHKGQAASQARLRLVGWTVYVTNAPPELLSVREVLVLARARWQIELLFRLWKSCGQVDKSRSTKPWRILCEVYAKLLAMVAQHWLLLISCWGYPDRSLYKATHTVRKHSLHLASHLGCQERLGEVIMVIQRCLAAGCRINKRRTEPHTYQLLLNAAEGGLT
jgi:hypothetical protein